MKTANRNYGLDVLRLICMLILATFHFMNYYGLSYISPNTNGSKAYVIQTLGWGGGRMICNVFLFISAWYLCEKPTFKIERIIKVLFTVEVYIIIVGVAFWVKGAGNIWLVSHIFPIATNLVWYATMYIGILILSPMLNRLLSENNRGLTRNVVCIFFLIICVVPTFYPKYARLGSVLSWYIMAYLAIGLMKVYRINLNRTLSCIMFIVGYGVTILFYNAFANMPPFVANTMKVLGFYNNVYFSDLATLCGGGLRFISIASLDVYIVSSMESPNIKLAWVELFKPDFVPNRTIQCYYVILVGLLLGIILGNVREYIWKRIIEITKVKSIFNNIDERFNGAD